MKYTVGSVPYLNAKPLIRMFEELGSDTPVHVLYDVPSQLTHMLEDGRAQAIMVSSIEALRTPGTRVASGVCIGSHREVLSVRLYSKVPPAQIRTLALDRSSATSNALAQIVLTERHGVTPVAECRMPSLTEMLATYDACVLIGDNGIRENGDGLHVLDLGLEWFELTGLPFVWAVWVGDETLTPELSRYLSEAADWGLAHLDLILETAPQEVGIPRELCEQYFKTNMHYPMGDLELQGLEEFANRLKRTGILPEFHLPTLV